MFQTILTFRQPADMALHTLAKVTSSGTRDQGCRAWALEAILDSWSQSWKLSGGGARAWNLAPCSTDI